jgi:hypothetical protein
MAPTGYPPAPSLIAGLSCDSLTFFIIGLVVTHPYNITHQLVQLFKSKQNKARKNSTKKCTGMQGWNLAY